MRYTLTLSLLVSVSLLTACDSGLPDWLGSDKDGPPLEGKRLAVLPMLSEQLKPDPSLANDPVSLPDATSNDAWPQEGGNAGQHIGIPAFSGKMDRSGDARIGKGNAGESTLIVPPVVAGGTVYAMDAEGVISAHNAADVDSVRWVSAEAASDDDDEIMGGGLAVEGNTLYASTGEGRIVAIDTANGKARWKTELHFPLRSAPRVLDDRVYVITRDNQLFALNATSGNVLWNQRGINEGAGYLNLVTAAASSDAVIVPYSSGEVFALRPATGEELWSDSLIMARRTSATGVFTGVDANPVIDGGRVFAVGSGGLMSVTELMTGRRVWEQEISSLNTPWIAGDYVFVLTAESQVVCLRAGDGRVQWATALPSYEDEDKKNSLVWTGPVAAGKAIYIVGAHGKMLALNPADGKIAATLDIPDEVYTAPVVAGGIMFLVDKNATLYAYR